MKNQKESSQNIENAIIYLNSKLFDKQEKTRFGKKISQKVSEALVLTSAKFKIKVSVLRKISQI